MTIERQAQIARDMTGSTINTNDLINGLKRLDNTAKSQIYSKMRNIFEGNKVPFDKAFFIAREQINEVANSYKIDPAILFWVCMEMKK